MVALSPFLLCSLPIPSSTVPAHRFCIDKQLQLGELMPTQRSLITYLFTCQPATGHQLGPGVKHSCLPEFRASTLPKGCSEFEVLVSGAQGAPGPKTLILGCLYLLACGQQSARGTQLPALVPTHYQLRGF